MMQTYILAARASMHKAQFLLLSKGNVYGSCVSRVECILVEEELIFVADVLNNYYQRVRVGPTSL